MQGNTHDWKAGTVEIMTAGKGVMHTEEITEKTDVRILQLWLALSPGKRWTEPFFQKITLENVPALRTDNFEIRVYSGSSNGLISPMLNQTPFTLVDFSMKPNAEARQELPLSYNGFIYVVDGSMWVSGRKVAKEQAAWLDQNSRVTAK